MPQMPFEPTWESLRSYVVPQWFEDAKLGVFVHWGPYSVPAFDNEWYARNMYQPNHLVYRHHREKWGAQSRFGYKDFIPLLTAEKFDPDEWVDLFIRAGARYVVPVAEHHDGFAMYDTALSAWNAARMGPKRDVIGELARATRKRDLVFGLSSHRAEHWWFFDGGKTFESDVQDPRHADLYGPAMPAAGGGDYTTEAWNSRDWEPRPDAQFLDDWLARCRELVDKYQPQLVYFDWWISQRVFEPYLQEFASYYYNRGADWQQGVVITQKHDAFPEGTAVFDLERGKLSSIREAYWQADTSISYKSWCYIEDDEWKPAASLIHTLVDVVSKNGNLLLNVGPKPDGTIPGEAARLLHAIGDWLDVNGDAIYGTRPWLTYGEGNTAIGEGHMREREDKPFTAQDIRFTTRENSLYAICLGWPGETALIKSLGAGSAVNDGMIEAVHMLGSEEPLAWSQTEQGMAIRTPSHKPCDHAYTFKITLNRRA